MQANTFKLTRGHSEYRILKNLTVISLAFLFLYSGDEGLIMLQTSINKEGVGATTMAVSNAANGITSLLFTSYLVKKLGTKNSQILGVIMFLPFIISNIYPMWIPMLLSGALRGIAYSLLWSAQCTYFSDSCVLYCRIKNNSRKSRNATNKKPIADTEKDIKTLKSNVEKVEQLAAFDLLHKTDDAHNPDSNRNSNIYPTETSDVRITAYRYEKDGISQSIFFSEAKNTEISRKTEDHDMKMFNDSRFLSSKNLSDSRKEDVIQGSHFENVKEGPESENYCDYVQSTKALFFGIHGMMFNAGCIFGNLISYYILEKGDKGNYNTTSNFSCGAEFCATNKYDLKNNVNEVSDDTRYLLIGVFMASAVVAPILLLFFLDQMAETTKIGKLSWTHVFATIKYIKKKEQLLLIPFTLGACFVRAFYLADFTKSYIACAWSISQIGLISIIYGSTAALSSILSGVMIKYAGRTPVMVLFQIVTIANIFFLFFWNPDRQQSYMFYIQGGVYGMITGIFNSQIKALYGIFFEGDEATAFSSFNLYNAIGWTLPFIYNDFLCVSVKIYIVLAFSFIGLIGYLLAERSYSCRNKQMKTPI